MTLMRARGVPPAPGEEQRETAVDAWRSIGSMGRVLVTLVTVFLFGACGGHDAITPTLTPPDETSEFVRQTDLMWDAWPHNHPPGIAAPMHVAGIGLRTAEEPM